MAVYDTVRLDNLFSELARLTIYRVINHKTKGYIYPNTEMKDINILFKKYIDLYINGKFQILNMETTKDILIYSRNTEIDETSIMCLIIIKENMDNVMTGNCIQILEISKSYVSDKKYKQLKSELEKHKEIPKSKNIIIDIEN